MDWIKAGMTHSMHVDVTHPDQSLCSFLVHSGEVALKLMYSGYSRINKTFREEILPEW